MLKANSKKTLDIIAGQTKRNATQAYKETHPNVTTKTAQSAVNKLLNKPESQIYLNQHVDKAKQTIVSLLDSDKEEMQYKSAQDILDRNLGKAIQQVQTSTVGVTLNIDLTSALPDQDVIDAQTP